MTKDTLLIFESVQWYSCWAIEYFKVPDLIQFRLVLLQSYLGKVQFPESDVQSISEPLQQNQTPRETADSQYGFTAKFILLAAQAGIHPNKEFIYISYLFNGKSMHLCQDYLFSFFFFS